MDATRWLTNTALAYSRRYQVDAHDVYTELYARWMDGIEAIESLSSHDPDRVRRYATAALHRWADDICRRLHGEPRAVVRYSHGQIRGMLPMLVSFIDPMGFSISGEQLRVSGGVPAHERGDQLVGWIDLRSAWCALPAGQQRALYVVYVASEREEGGYDSLMDLEGITYDTARKRVSRAMSALHRLMGGHQRERIFVDFDAELVA